MLQIRDRSAIAYLKADACGFVSQKRRDNMLTVRRNRYTGEITAGSRKRLSKCLTLMAQGNPAKMKYNPVNNRMMWHHLTFCTLTIPGKNISARRAYDTLLSHFLDWLTRTKEVKAYIWKAELQQRGQIH